MEIVRRRVAGRDSGRVLLPSWKDGTMGEAGAYISESWESSDGDVNAEKSCLTLSHCVWVVSRDECSATRMEDEEVGVDEPYDVLLERSSFSRILMASCTTDSHSLLDAIRSFKDSKEGDISCLGTSFAALKVYTVIAKDMSARRKYRA